VIWCEATKKRPWVIDPGGDVRKFSPRSSDPCVGRKDLADPWPYRPCRGAAELPITLKVPIEGPHIADKHLLDNAVTSGARFGMTGVRDFAPDRWLDERRSGFRSAR